MDAATQLTVLGLTEYANAIYDSEDFSKRFFNEVPEYKLIRLLLDPVKAADADEAAVQVYHLGLDKPVSSGRQLGNFASRVTGVETVLDEVRYYVACDKMQQDYCIDLVREKTLESAYPDKAQAAFKNTAQEKRILAETDLRRALHDQFLYGASSFAPGTASITDPSRRGMMTLIGGQGAVNVYYYPQSNDEGASGKYMGLLRFESPAAQITNNASFQRLARSKGDTSTVSRYWYNQYGEVSGWAHAQRWIDAAMSTWSERAANPYGSQPTLGVTDQGSFTSMSVGNHARVDLSAGDSEVSDGTLAAKQPHKDAIMYSGIKFFSDPKLSLTRLNKVITDDNGDSHLVTTGCSLLLNPNSFRVHRRMSMLTNLMGQGKWKDFSDPMMPEKIYWAMQDSRQYSNHDPFTNGVIVGLGG